MTKNECRVWIGKRESDAATCSYFDFTITYYGSNKENNFSFSRIYRNKNIYKGPFADFAIECLKEIQAIAEEKEIKIQVYTSSIAYEIISKENKYESFFIAVNPFPLTQWMNNKIYSRIWLSESVKIPPFKIMSKKECTMENLEETFHDFNEFIFQKDVSSGGNGTYLMNEKNFNSNIGNIENVPYMVSPYFKKSHSCSSHMVIGEDDYVIFPPCVQIISHNKEHMLYRGSNYFQAEQHLKSKFNLIYLFNQKIAEKLQNLGYRGICGTDYLVIDEDIFFIEINPRFQGSSFLINYFLEKNSLPTLFDLNSDAFNEGKKIRKYKNQIENMSINASCLYYTSKSSSYLKKNGCKDFFYYDGYDSAIKIDTDIYLYRILRLY